MSHVILSKQSRRLNALSELRVLGGKTLDTFFGKRKTHKCFKWAWAYGWFYFISFTILNVYPHFYT